jgi:hypothetical protein
VNEKASLFQTLDLTSQCESFFMFVSFAMRRVLMIRLHCDGVIVTQPRMTRFVIWARLLIIGLFCASPCAHAISTNGGFASKCTYSHTAPDDSIVHYGAPGQAMVHDFFSNTKTDAYSTYDTLLLNTVTTCEIGSDISAYWVPQLKRASGIVAPDFAKTYYMNQKPVVPLAVIPHGLQMLAGNHMGTGPNTHINFLCRGSNYTTVAPTNCPVVTDSQGTYSQLDISVHFPECWDGVNLRPDYLNQVFNMAYSNSDGTCPAGYPVKIPELEMNIQYSLGQDPDLSTAQLSMDPMLVSGGYVPRWGSLYTAHGDFINAWKDDTMKYAVDKCSNLGISCGTLPTFWSEANANVWLGANGTTDTGTTFQIAPGDTVFLKFPTPEKTADYKWSKASLQTQGHNATDSTAVFLNMYAASTTWGETGTLPQAADCTTQAIGGIYLDSGDQRRLNDVTNYIKSVIASASPMIGICMRNNSGKLIVLSTRTGVFAPGIYMN